MTQPRRGRPRDDRARTAVLEALPRLLAEVGYDRLTIDAIATAGGVSRPTIYRWWTAKSAIIAEAVRAGAIALPAPRVSDTGDIRTDLEEWLSGPLVAMHEPANRALIRALTAAAADDTSEATSLYSAVTGPGHVAIVARLASATAQGQIREHADLPAIASTLFGHIVYGTLTPVPPGTAAGLVSLLLDGAATQPSER